MYNNNSSNKNPLSGRPFGMHVRVYNKQKKDIKTPRWRPPADVHAAASDARRAFASPLKFLQYDYSFDDDYAANISHSTQTAMTTSEV